MGEQAQPLEAPSPPDVERADIEVPTQIIDKDSQDISACYPSARTFLSVKQQLFHTKLLDHYDDLQK